MTTPSNVRILPKAETVLIDGLGGCKFERCYIGIVPAIIIDHPQLHRKVIITGEVLAGINGWLARLVQETKIATRH